MKNNNQMDERQLQISTKAMACGFVFLFACIIIAMFYNIFTTGEAGWEFWAMLGSTLVILIARRILGDVEQPRNLMGKPLPTGSSKNERQLRKKDYALQSLIFAAVCTVMEVLLISFGKEENTDISITQTLLPGLPHLLTVVITAVLTFAVMFLISYSFEYLLGEKYKVRKYNQMLAELDADED